jgi:hypothetical protein
MAKARLRTVLDVHSHDTFTCDLVTDLLKDTNEERIQRCVCWRSFPLVVLTGSARSMILEAVAWDTEDGAAVVTELLFNALA